MKHTRSDNLLRPLAWTLLALGAAGVALQLELLPKLARIALGWGAWLAAGGPVAGWPLAADSSPLDTPLADLYHTLTFGQPLVPWFLWLVGALLVFHPWQRPPRTRQATPPADDLADEGLIELVPTPRAVRAGMGEVVRAPRRTLRRARQRLDAPGDSGISPHNARRAGELLILACLVGICLLGAGMRATNLLPDQAGRWPASNFDEMVYYSNARLLAQGDLPYRDHFLAHPPGAAYLFSLPVLGAARWGGPQAFASERLWLLLLSVLALPLLYLAGRRLGGPTCGLLAALILALDGRVAGVAVLETAVNLFSLLALVLYLYTPRLLPRPQRVLWTVLVGVCAGGAVLAKIPGLAIALALPLHALVRRQGRQAALLLGAVGGGLVLGLVPFLILAPGELLRQTFFFQMLRPQEVRPGIDQASRIAEYPESVLTTGGAALGLLALTLALIVVRERRAWLGLRGWLVVILWAVPVLGVFAIGRSYHAPYYVQWAPPLALLAAAVAARPVWRVLGAALPRQPSTGLLADALAAGVALLVLPLVGAAWQAGQVVERDQVYFSAGATLAALPLGPHGGQTLAFDPGYTFLAGRPPAPMPGLGRLVDSAGAMVYYGQDIDRASLPDLLGRVLRFNRERNAQETFYALPAQAVALAALPNADAVVLDGKIAIPQLRPQTQQAIQQLSGPPQQVEYATIYPLLSALDSAGAAPSHPLYSFHPPDGFDLWMGTAEALRGDGSGLGAHPIEQGTEGAGYFSLPADAAVIQLGLYWRVPPAFDKGDYRIGLRLTDSAGRLVTQTDTRPGEDQESTTTWRPGGLYPDLHNLPLPPAPGLYHLTLTVAPAGQSPTAEDSWQTPLTLDKR